MTIKPGIKPLSWGASLLALLCVAFMYYITHYVFIPYYTKITGQPYLIGYLIGWITTVGTIFLASLLAYEFERNKFNFKDFSIAAVRTAGLPILHGHHQRIQGLFIRVVSG
jgi:hypothetical protein